MIPNRLVLSSILVFALVAAVAAHAGRHSAAEKSVNVPRARSNSHTRFIPANAVSAAPTISGFPYRRLTATRT
jgi:hypothetical protein